MLISDLYSHPSDGHIEYNIHINPTRTIHRRYRQFVVLHRRLNHASLRLPLKKWLGNTNPGFLDERMSALQEYLHGAIALARYNARARTELSAFLEMTRQEECDLFEVSGVYGEEESGANRDARDMKVGGENALAVKGDVAEGDRPWEMNVRGGENNKQANGDVVAKGDVAEGNRSREMNVRGRENDEHGNGKVVAKGDVAEGDRPREMNVRGKKNDKHGNEGVITKGAVAEGDRPREMNVRGGGNDEHGNGKVVAKGDVAEGDRPWEMNVRGGGNNEHGNEKVVAKGDGWEMNGNDGGNGKIDFAGVVVNRFEEHGGAVIDKRIGERGIGEARGGSSQQGYHINDDSNAPPSPVMAPIGYETSPIKPIDLAFASSKSSAVAVVEHEDEVPSFFNKTGNNDNSAFLLMAEFQTLQLKLVDKEKAIADLRFEFENVLEAKAKSTAEENVEKKSAQFQCKLQADELHALRSEKHILTSLNKTANVKIAELELHVSKINQLVHDRQSEYERFTARLTQERDYALMALAEHERSTAQLTQERDYALNALAGHAESSKVERLRMEDVFVRESEYLVAKLHAQYKEATMTQKQQQQQQNKTAASTSRESEQRERKKNAEVLKFQENAQNIPLKSFTAKSTSFESSSSRAGESVLGNRQRVPLAVLNNNNRIAAARAVALGSHF